MGRAPTLSVYGSKWYGHYLQQLPMMASPRLRKPGAAVVQDVNGFGMAAPD